LDAPVIRVIAMPADTNPAGDIFGGWLMSWMDLAAGTVAARRSQGRAATLKAEAMSFLRPVAVGDEVSFYADLVSEGRSSMKIHVEAWRRLRHGEDTVKVTEATFTWVAIGQSGKSRPLPETKQSVIDAANKKQAQLPALVPGYPLPRQIRHGPPRVLCVTPHDNKNQLLWTWGRRTVSHP
jgi:acyl-CoA thioesterase YciA